MRLRAICTLSHSRRAMQAVRKKIFLMRFPVVQGCTESVNGKALDPKNASPPSLPTRGVVVFSDTAKCAATVSIRYGLNWNLHSPEEICIDAF